MIDTSLEIHVYSFTILGIHVHIHVCMYRYVLCNITDNLVRSEASKDVHLLEHSQFFPVFWEGVRVWVHTVVILLPLFHHATECHSNALES